MVHITTIKTFSLYKIRIKPFCYFHYVYIVNTRFFILITNSSFCCSWYQGDRTHGLIMGCAVVGTKPEGWAAPSRTSPSDTPSNSDSSSDSDSSQSSLGNRVLNIVMDYIPMTVFRINHMFNRLNQPVHPILLKLYTY